MIRSTYFPLLSIFLIISCTPNQQNSSLSPTDRKKYLSEGTKIAQASSQALGTKLKAAISEKGTVGAVKYCNLEAISLIDSLSQAHQVIIKRTSLKVRNPIDEPDSLEKVVLNLYQQQHTKGQQIQPTLNQLPDGTIMFNAPIFMKPLCLNCHGALGKQLNTQNYKTIQQLYPEDEAINYKATDLRGMWSIKFYEQQPSNQIHPH